MACDGTLWDVLPCPAMCHRTSYVLPWDFRRKVIGCPMGRHGRPWDIVCGSIMANVAHVVAYAVGHPVGPRTCDRTSYIQTVSRT